MPQTKYSLPDDLKQRCLSFVKGYKRLIKQYTQKRNEILYSSKAPADGMPRSGRTGDETFEKTRRLEQLDSLFDAAVIKAVDKAKQCIGLDIQSAAERRRIAEAVWDSCTDGRNFIFEYRALCVGKTNFYDRRREFLYNIAKNMQFLT